MKFNFRIILFVCKADTADKIGRSPLHYAANIGSEEMVKSLITSGADVNCRYEVHSWPRVESSVTVCGVNGECQEPKFSGCKVKATNIFLFPLF